MSTITENANLEIILPVILPSGVNASDVNVVNVKVTLAPNETKQIDDIQYIDDNHWYSWKG